jgi:hypothetical protein
MGDKAKPLASQRLTALLCLGCPESAAIQKTLELGVAVAQRPQRIWKLAANQIDRIGPEADDDRALTRWLSASKLHDQTRREWCHAPGDFFIGSNGHLVGLVG